MNEFKKYLDLKSSGSTAVQIAKQAGVDGLDQITRIRLVRQVCDMSLGQAKEVLLMADGTAASLEEHQLRLAGIVEESFAQKHKEPTP